MKKILLGTNLKMYKTPHETGAYISELSELVYRLTSDADFFVIPSFVCLPAAKDALKNKSLMLGAQNMHWEAQGQFTGEVSPVMLKDLGGISIIEIGHSERRNVFGETSEECNYKVKSALQYGFNALLCIGETGREKGLGVSDETLIMQIKIGLLGVLPVDLPRVWIAYEPVWSIGVNGTPASNDYVQKKCSVIRKTLNELYGGYENNVPILYGGSVNPENADGLIKETDVDGLFIGRAAWKAQAFYELSKRVIEEWKSKNKTIK